MPPIPPLMALLLPLPSLALLGSVLVALPLPHTDAPLLPLPLPILWPRCRRLVPRASSRFNQEAELSSLSRPGLPLLYGMAGDMQQGR